MNLKLIQDRFVARKFTLCTAESCTGGNIAHQITLVPGSSDYFIGSVVSYSNKVKVDLLGVRGTDIKRFGAVSESVAIQMARGICELLKADLAISTTGIAGPSGGTSQKPVGTVWIGVSSKTTSYAKKFSFEGNREEVINQTTQKAFEMVLLAIDKVDVK